MLSTKIYDTVLGHNVSRKTILLRLADIYKNHFYSECKDKAKINVGNTIYTTNETVSNQKKEI